MHLFQSVSFIKEYVFSLYMAMQLKHISLKFLFIEWKIIYGFNLAQQE